MSDQYVSVPRDLLERLQLALSTCYCPETSVTTDLWKLLAAPTEDVRAVGYASDNQLARLARGHAETCDLFAKSSSVLGSASALYRHPLRPVVLPGRKDPGNAMSEPYDPDSWNACIDEFERLNK